LEPARPGQSVDGRFYALVPVWDLQAALGAGESVDVVDEARGEVDEFAFGAEGQARTEEYLNSTYYYGTRDFAIERSHNVLLTARLPVLQSLEDYVALLRIAKRMPGKL
jgi:hypothetical protein